MAAGRRLKRRLGAGALWLVVGALALTGVAPARQAFEQREELAEARQQVAELEASTEELRSRLARQDDPAYLEKLAREQLGVVRPGETAYVVAPAPELPDAAGEPEPEGDGGLRQRVADWIKELMGSE